MPESSPHDAVWHRVLVEGDPGERRAKRLFRRLPTDPRCRLCFAPFGGLGGALVGSLLARRPSVYSPRICSFCDEQVRKHPGGAELELTLLFADVRGSTQIAEGMSPSAFGRLMDRFYTAATHAVAYADGMIEKFVGDEVTALFVPGLTGPDHAAKALEAARELLRATGHGTAGGPWLPIGAGIHTGVAFVGSIGSGGVQQLAALGDAANTAARLAASAPAGEILLSEAAARAAGLEGDDLEHRVLTLRGVSQPVGVYVQRVGTDAAG